MKDILLSLLPIQKNEMEELNNNQILLPEIPFYGISGSICRVEEAEESYYKVLYNQNGTINPHKIPVPKKKTKNFNLIVKDYCEDIKNYLEKYENKYLEIENTIINPTLTKNQYYALITVTILASLASIPFLFTTSIAGVIFGSISMFSLYLVYDINKKDTKKIKDNNNFKKRYKELQRSYVDYKNGNPIYKVKTNETVYTEIEKVDKSNLKFFPKIKILTKEEIKKVA